ncbi:hypothetical protein BRYFOR_09896 [Marvinbryantia formatexigens DSM 14469]|uniref:Uncharacterized protein n=1 Tax=Marvinbryantia formatexigens DSM 14469 TaxID=478749 RepID=C6LMJ5_9FIRM|nr:hypothetical protein BRYFOR_09896 [Marvinbryantia formatexigens DSM 14469]
MAAGGIMEENVNKRSWVLYLAIAQLVLAVAVMVYGTVTRKMTGRQSDILIAASLLVFWILSDILEPVVMKRFKDITQEQKTAYIKFLVLDFAGLAGIAYFLYSMGNAGGNGLVGAIIYVITMKPKRDSQDIFYHGVPEEKDETEQETENVLEQTDGEADESEDENVDDPRTLS